jgi:hypothetical protein
VAAAAALRGCTPTTTQESHVAATEGPGSTPSGVAATDPVAANARPDGGGGPTGAVVVVALVSAISGLLNGYETSIISGALLQISDEFGIGTAGSG